jgi:hypothetical protein
MSKGAISDKEITDGMKSVPGEESRPAQRKNNAEIRARQRAIGRELRRMYDEITREPIPDDFLDLLHQLDSKDQNPGERDA